MLRSPHHLSHFRSRELNQILGILNEREPAVITLSGAPGMGKTSLVDAVRARSAARGWAIAGSGGERIAVDPGTREQQFRHAVLASFDMPEDTGVVRARREAALSAPTHSERVDPFIDELARLSPVLLPVDDYRPSPLFADWFEDSFLPAVRGSRVPIVVIVAPPDTQRPLQQIATHPIELAPLDSDVIRSALLELDLDPPLTEDELEIYVADAATPLMLDSLTRVLALASRHDMAA